MKSVTSALSDPNWHDEYLLILDKLAGETEPVDLDLYVHVPFCRSKCHFCQWVARIPTQKLLHSEPIYGDYVGAVLSQMDAYLTPLMDRIDRSRLKIQNIYFGGGTPTLLEADDLVLILNQLKGYFDKPLMGTATIEGSPDTVNRKQLEGLRKGGFDRISFGVQSFDDTLLQKMGRTARSHHAIEAVEASRDAGFSDLNLDIMYGLAGETDSSWQNTVLSTVALQPDHISCYRYYSDPDSVSRLLENKGVFKSPNSQRLFQRYRFAREVFAANGYKEYISGLFHKGGKHCGMDENYFNLTAHWLGFGAGANSLFGQHRWANTQKLDSFLKDPTEAVEVSVESSGWAISLFKVMLMTPSIDKTLLKKKLGLTIQELCESNEIIRSIYVPLHSKGDIIETPTHIRWSDLSKRAEWMCRDVENQVEDDPN